MPMIKRTHLYFNKTTGSVVKATKSQAKKLPDDYQRIEFVKNSAGERVMRFKFDGATVDVSETGEKEVTPDVVRVAE